MALDTVNWSAHLNNEITVSGLAQNAKLGALLMTGPNDAILIRGLSEWDTQTEGKKVRVVAIVRRMPGAPKAEGPKSTQMQGTASGRDTWVLELKYYQLTDD